jgi:aspartyl-tRNA(Asn)/glutamyl-tRNA(Gln) amidotransferase subunit C
MKITKDEVIHVAELARLEIDDAQIDRFADQLGTILAYFDTLNHIDTRGVKPTFHALFSAAAFREDGETGPLDHEAALSNAPEKEDGYFIVPKVIG